MPIDGIGFVPLPPKLGRRVLLDAVIFVVVLVDLVGLFLVNCIVAGVPSALVFGVVEAALVFADDVVFGDLPAFDLVESGVVDGDFEGEFGHPDGEAGEAGVGSVLDQDRGVAGAADFGAIDVDTAAGGRDLEIEF